MRTEVVEGKLHGTFQMLINSPFAFVGKRDDFIEECCIAGLRDIFVNSREQPEGVVCAVGGVPGLLHVGGVVRRVFMPRVVGEFYKRKPAAVIYLCREHKTDLLTRHFRREVDDPLDILHCIAVAVAVAKPAVNKGRGS